MIVAPGIGLVLYSGGSKRDVVWHLGWPIAPRSRMSPNARGGGVATCEISAQEYSCTQEVAASADSESRCKRSRFSKSLQVQWIQQVTANAPDSASHCKCSGFSTSLQVQISKSLKVQRNQQVAATQVAASTVDLASRCGDNESSCIGFSDCKRESCCAFFTRLATSSRRIPTLHQERSKDESFL